MLLRELGAGQLEEAHHALDKGRKHAKRLIERTIAGLLGEAD